MRDLEFSEDDIILNLSVPSQNNSNKKMKEILKNKYMRQKVCIGKSDKKRFYEDDTGIHFDIEEFDEYTVTLTRNFQIVNTTEEEFLNAVKQIDLMRFD